MKYFPDDCGEFVVGICVAVGHEIFFPVNLFFDASERNLGQVFGVDKGEELFSEACLHVESFFYHSDEEQVIFVARAVNPCRAEDDVWEAIDGFQVIFRQEFAVAVVCVGIAALVGHEGGVIFFVAGSHDAQRAYQDEAFGDGIRFDEGLDEVAGILEVDPVEICFQGCFCDSCAMDDVVELSVFLHEAGNLFDQFAGMGVVEVDETDAGVLQVGAAACGADAGPRFEALTERFVNDGASYESAGAGDEDFFLFHSFFRFVGGSRHAAYSETGCKYNHKVLFFIAVR